LPPETDRSRFIDAHHDRMTECIYRKPLKTFDTGIEPERVYKVPLIEEGAGAMNEVNRGMGLGMDEWDIKYYYNLFTNTIGIANTRATGFLKAI